jgi:hypothetical protein
VDNLCAHIETRIDKGYKKTFKCSKSVFDKYEKEYNTVIFELAKVSKSYFDKGADNSAVKELCNKYNLVIEEFEKKWNDKII